MDTPRRPSAAAGQVESCPGFGIPISPAALSSTSTSAAGAAISGLWSHDIVDADERNDSLAFPGFVRTAPSSAAWTANRLAGSLALAFSLTK